MRVLRSIALAAFLVLASTACDAAQELADRAGDAASEVADELQTLAPDQDGGDGDAPAGDGRTDGPDDPGSGGDGGDDGSAPGAPEGPGSAGATPVDDLGGVGANGRALLRPDRPAVVIEVDTQEDTTADRAALDHLVDELGRYADKPGGIRFEGGNSFASDRRSWSGTDIRAVAEANRSTRSSDDAVSLYLVYVRGEFTSGGESTNAIGVATNASEIALFPEAWSGLGGLLGGSRAIERAVLVHELGHALGLVNLTYTSPIDHEDPDYPGHSRNEGSVMYWAVETSLIGQVFSGPPPDRFDDADATDLQGLRDGSL